MPNWSRHVLVWLGLAIAAGGLLWFGLQGKLEQGGSFAVAGILLMIGSRFDQLASIEVAGVKAQLQEKVKEADAAIREMRELAITLADPLLKHGMSLGRWSQGLNLVEAKEFQDSIDGVLQRLEVPNETRAKLRRHYEYFTLIDLCQISAKSVQKSMLEQEQEERSDIAKRFGSPVSDHAGLIA